MRNPKKDFNNDFFHKGFFGDGDSWIADTFINANKTLLSIGVLIN